MENTLSPQWLSSVKASLIKINQICGLLFAVLERSPASVCQHTGSAWSQFKSCDDQELNVDVILRGLNSIDRHLDNILSALKTHSLYEKTYTVGQQDTTSLVEALQSNRDILSAKRRENGFLNMTFGFRIDELTRKIDIIYSKIPLYTQKAA